MQSPNHITLLVDYFNNSRSIVKVIGEQGELIGRLNKAILNSSKYISIMSTTMGGMAQDLQSYGIEMKSYATEIN